MINNLQFLRSLNAGTSPVSLAAGQIAFNLVDKKLFVGDGSDSIKRLNGSTESVSLGSGYFESDLSVLTANAYTDQKIAELIDSAPELLNTLNELAAAIADDPNFVSTVTTAVSNVQSNLDAEVSRAQGVEASLTGALSAESARATAAESAIAGDLAAEVARATAAEGVLTSDLAAEVSRAQGAEAALQSNLDTEASTRLGADSVLQANIDSEAGSRQLQDSILQANIDTESAARAAGDTTLQSNIDSEAAARAAADLTLQGNIDAEAAARNSSISSVQADLLAEYNRALAAEAALSARIADIENGIDLGTFGGGSGGRVEMS